MADVKWIKITTDIFDDEKIKLIEAMPDSDSILVIWFKLLTLCGKINAGGGALVMRGTNIPYTEDMLITILNRPANTVRFALKIFEQYGMIEITDNNVLCISNWEKHQNIIGLEEIKKKNAERQRRFKNKQKLKQLEDAQDNDESNVTNNVSSNVTKRYDDVTVTTQSKSRVRVDKDIDNSSTTKKILTEYNVNSSSIEIIIKELDKKQKGTEYLLEKIEVVERRVKDKQNNLIKDNVGLLVNAIKDDWKMINNTTKKSKFHNFDQVISNNYSNEELEKLIANKV